jgi:hypothetical protein
MLGEGAHVEHDKFRLTKHLGVDPLQNEVLFRFGIQGYQEGVIDIAIPIFMDVNDRALWFELVCSGNEIVQGFVLGIEIFIQRAEVSVFCFLPDTCLPRRSSTERRRDTFTS